MQEYGCQNMVGRLRRVIVRRPDENFSDADPKRWHYKSAPDLSLARAEHRDFVDILKKAGAEVIFHDEPLEGLADAIFTHDSALITDSGSIILQMGKQLRNGEEAAMGRLLGSLAIPELGRLHGDARAEGGDLLWLDRDTLAIGVGFRTNEQGAEQLAEILDRIGVRTIAYDLPAHDGPDACLHLMSLISMVDQDLAVVYTPLLPARLLTELEARGVALVEAPADEFLQGQATNVLALGPRDALLLEGNKVTEERLRAAGCRVRTYRGNEITLKAEGGATCLTRPILRDEPERAAGERRRSA